MMSQRPLLGEVVRIERVQPDEEETFLRVLCEGFDLDITTARPMFFHDPYFAFNQRWGLWVKVRRRTVLASIATAIPLQFWLRGRPVSGYGVAGVTTLREFRRRGFAHQLLRAMIASAHQEAIPGLALQAFDHSFYRKLGWQTVGTLTRLRIPPNYLPPFPTQGVRRMVETDAEAVFRLYESTRSDESGRLVRDDLRWHYLFWNIRNKWVYDAQGQVEGYLMYDFLDGGWVMRVRELVAATEHARRTLIGWLATNPERVHQIEFAGTLADLQPIAQYLSPALGQAPERPIATFEQAPGLMWRITHPQAMLQAVLAGRPAPEPFQPFTLNLRDPLLPLEQRWLQVVAPTGSLQVVTLHQNRPAPPIFLDSLALNSLMWGSESPSALWARKQIQGDESLLPVLEALFAPQAVCLRPVDFF